MLLNNHQIVDGVLVAFGAFLVTFGIHLFLRVFDAAASFYEEQKKKQATDLADRLTPKHRARGKR